MTIDLSTYSAIESNLFVRIDVEYYKATESSSPISQTLLFSDRLISTVINGDTYTGLGKLVSITNSSSELKVSSNSVTIVLSGIPNTSISEIINSRIKGSPVKIVRGIFDANTGQFLSSVSGNPITRFMGYVNNLSLSEDYNVETQISTNTLVLVCASVVDVLDNKISGRKTNPSSQKKYYPTDISMDRVPTLESSYFDFGAKP